MHLPDMLDQLAALDAHTLVFSFAELERLQHWIPYFRRRFLAPAYEQRRLTVPDDVFQRTRFLADPKRTVYQAYGLGRNSVWRVYGPGIIWQYIKWGIQGRPIRMQEDTLQRGGDFVVGRDGLLKLIHTGRDQSDRPSVSAILTALRDA